MTWFGLYIVMGLLTLLFAFHVVRLIDNEKPEDMRPKDSWLMPITIVAWVGVLPYYLYAYLKFRGIYTGAGVVINKITSAPIRFYHFVMKERSFKNV